MRVAHGLGRRRRAARRQRQRLHPFARLRQLAVRAQNWKLIRSRHLGEELYDLGADPGELENLVESTQPGALEPLGALRRLLDGYDASRSSPGGGPVDVSDEVRAALEALGYTD